MKFSKVYNFEAAYINIEFDTINIDINKTLHKDRGVSYEYKSFNFR